MEKTSAGIDLGTTNSCIAVLQGGTPVAVRNDEGAPTTPSVVAVLPEGILVGKKARSYLLTQPAQTFVSIKRRMGERYSRTVLGREYTPELVSSIILSHLKGCAERSIGRKIEDVVVTVPANFNSTQRQATKDAGEIAGLGVLRVINEPTAAALSYGHANKLSAILVVFDLGGGTFDISVVEAGDGLYEVVHSQGDNHLGGDDFNMRIVQWITKEFGAKTGHDIRRDVNAVKLVHEWAVAAKHTLTNAPEVRVKIDNLYKGQGFEATLTRSMYAEMVRPLLERLRSVARSVSQELSKPKYREAYPGAFDNDMAACDILLVGGETRVPCVRELVKDVFKGRFHRDVNPDEAVAHGAAIQAGIIDQKGDMKDIVLVDTTSLSLGTEVEGGLFSKIIEANTPIPCSKTSEYAPVEDMQTSIMVGVYQGESELCEKNIKLGEFEFLLQPPRPREEAMVELTYHLDADDILHVSAVDKKTGAKQDVTIKGSQNLDREAVERLRRDALASQPEDSARARTIRKRGDFRNLAREVLGRLQGIPAEGPAGKFVQKTRGYAERLLAACEAEDEAEMDQCARELEAAWQKVLAALPAGSAPVPTPAPDGSGGEGGEGGEATVLCANCGARIPPGFAFCGKCGVPLKKTVCDGCGAALVDGFSFCGRCGKKV